jgi:hypothetical protein
MTSIPLGKFEFYSMRNVRYARDVGTLEVRIDAP